MKSIARIVAVLLGACLSMGQAYAQFTPGQILTAAQLNSALAAKLPLTGGALSGPLTAPSLSVTGTATLPNALITGGTITGLSASNLGTPSAVVLTNATGLPLSTGVTGVASLSNLPTGTSGNALPLMSGANTWSATQTFNAPISPYAGVFQTGGASAMQNLTGVSGSGFYASGAGAVYSFYPTVGYNAGDHQRAQTLMQFNTAQDATVSETGLSINATMNTGLAAAWAQSTAYATGSEIDTAGNVYKATTGGTSASTGTGPSGTGSAITDGSVTWAYQCVDQCNAKMPLFISAVAGSGAGKVWAGDVDLQLNTGWNGGFAPAFEIDMTNNSGTNCASCQNLFISGNAGTNTIGAGISMYSPSATNYQWVNGYQVTGAKSVQNASYFDAASGAYSYQDTGVHTYGMYLHGNYSVGALWSDQSLTVQYDNARINFFPASTTNQWRLISNVTSSSDGSMVLQHTTDGFNSNFTNAITGNPDGSVQVGKGLQLSGTTFSALPTCNSSTAGYMALVTDASAAIAAWHQQVTAGGGSNKAFIACNGSGWYAFDY